MFGEFNKVTKALNRLAELEDKIENETLVELPCKVGDTVYFVHQLEKEYVMDVGYVKHISVENNGLWIMCHYSSGLSYWHISDYENIFFTHEQAEKRLEELQK